MRDPLLGEKGDATFQTDTVTDTSMSCGPGFVHSIVQGVAQEVIILQKVNTMRCHSPTMVHSVLG